MPLSSSSPAVVASGSLPVTSNAFASPFMEPVTTTAAASAPSAVSTAPIINYESTMGIDMEARSASTPGTSFANASPPRTLVSGQPQTNSAAAAPQPAWPSMVTSVSTSSYLRPTPPPTLAAPDVSATPPPSSSKLVPGVSHTRSPTQYTVSNKMIPLNLDGSDHHNPNRSAEPQYMSRARSLSEQKQSLTRTASESSGDGDAPMLPASSNGTSNDPDLHKNKSVTSSSHQHLARRVRSATTLRHAEEDRVPLKALVANKQRQHQYRLQPMTMTSRPLHVDQRQKKLVDHRRSISADNVEKCQVMLQHELESPNVSPMINDPALAIAPLVLDGVPAMRDQMDIALADLQGWLLRLNDSLKQLQC
ncbi:hypothetical protein BC940DRAFT_180853 [Gongronella butleri]|nr:hypothetical protein BC940DRAFT_180853 [Gongronella butleri]